MQKPVSLVMMSAILAFTLNEHVNWYMKGTYIKRMLAVHMKIKGIFTKKSECLKKKINDGLFTYTRLQQGKVTLSKFFFLQFKVLLMR